MASDKPLSSQQLKWRMRRGMLELDLILSRFMDAYGDKLSDDELITFAQLLEIDDPTLYAWFMGYEEVQDDALKPLTILIRQYGKP